MLFNIPIQIQCNKFMAGFRVQLMYTSTPSHLVTDCGNNTVGKMTGGKRRDFVPKEHASDK